MYICEINPEGKAFIIISTENYPKRALRHFIDDFREAGMVIKNSQAGEWVMEIDWQCSLPKIRHHEDRQKTLAQLLERYPQLDFIASDHSEFGNKKSHNFANRRGRKLRKGGTPCIKMRW